MLKELLPPDIDDWLIKHKDFNSFAQSLHSQYLTKGYLSFAQKAAVDKILEKEKIEKQKLRTKPTVGQGFTKMLQVFKNARANGYKHPTVRTEQFDFSLASDSSKNKGFVYVKGHLTKFYIGKISPAGILFTDVPQVVIDDIIRICENPLEEAIRFGAKTGNCSCCGKELTKKESVDLGIGPICRSKFFGF